MLALADVAAVGFGAVIVLKVIRIVQDHQKEKCRTCQIEQRRSLGNTLINILIEPETKEP